MDSHPATAATAAAVPRPCAAAISTDLSSTGQLIDPQPDRTTTASPTTAAVTGTIRLDAAIENQLTGGQPNRTASPKVIRPHTVIKWCGIAPEFFRARLACVITATTTVTASCIRILAARLQTASPTYVDRRGFIDLNTSLN